MKFFPDLKDWLEWLCQFKRPVVWNDYDDLCPDIDRRQIPRKNYFRCFSDENTVVEIAVRRLYELGHRRAVMPLCHCYIPLAWLGRRVDILKQTAARIAPDLAIEVIDQREYFWLRWIDNNDNAMLDHIQSIRSGLDDGDTQMTRAKRDALLRKALLRDFPSLTSIAEGRKATVVIAANQWLALNYYYWFKHTGISIPRDLSLISFDNYLRFAAHPVSTVDLNLNSLGYSASHIFIGDIPVRKDGRGNVPCHSRMIDKGTLGPPRK